MRKYHGLHALNHICLFTVLDTGNLRSRCQHGWILMGDFFLIGRQQPCSCFFSLGLFSDHTFKEKEVSGPFLAPNPIMRTPHSWSHLNLIISQRSHLQILSHWWTGFQHASFVGTQFSSQHSAQQRKRTCSLFLPSDTVWRQLKGGMESHLILKAEDRFFFLSSKI